MKYFLLNGSPRKMNNTGKLLESVKQGIIDSLKEENIDDVKVETINLFDINFTGCRSCFNCKLIDGPFYGRCPVNDDLRDLLPELWKADGIVVGSPIYFSDVTGQTRNLIERLIFPKLVYGGESITEKRVPTGLIFTMNAPKGVDDMYKGLYEGTAHAFSVAFKEPYIVVANNTVQFDDYSKYENYLFSEEDKLNYEKENFPKTLNEAYHMGSRIAHDSLNID